MRGVSHSGIIVQKRADPAWAALLRSDTNNVTLSTVDTYPKPNYLQSVSDPLFTQNGIPKIIRITGDSGTTNGPVTWGTEVYHNYFLYTPWNCTEKMIYLENNVGGSPSHLYLDGNTYAPLSPQPYHRSSGAQWHPTNPKAMHWASGGSFGITNDVTVGASTDVTYRTLAGYSSMTLGQYEGSINKSNANVLPLMAITGGGTVAFAYRVSDNTKWNDITPDVSPTGVFDSVQVSPSGRYLQIRDGNDALYIYDLLNPGPPNVTLVQTWAGSPPGNPTHSDVMMDASGVEYAVGRINSNHGAISKRRFDDGTITNLQTVSAFGRFTSARSAYFPYWLLASYDQTDGGASPYRGQVVALHLDGTKHVRICQLNTGNNSYYAGQDNVCFSPSGTRVIFNSNWFNSSSPPVHVFVADLRP